MLSCLIFLVPPSVKMDICKDYNDDGTTVLIVTFNVSIEYYNYIGQSVYLLNDLK